LVAKHTHSNGTSDGLYIPGHSFLHHLPAPVKIVAAISFILVVVATPPEMFWAFGVYGLIVLTLVAIAGIPFLTFARRLLIEVPFLIFAIFIPIIGTGPRVEVLGVSLSEAGLLSAWNILAKGTIGVSTSVVLASTTSARDLLAGLEKLKVPGLIVQIAGFMLRYVYVVRDDFERMRVARDSRAFHAKGPTQWKVLAQSGAALFVRSYERGERVHLAMLSRGYDGTIPMLVDNSSSGRQWLLALLLPLSALCVLLTALVLRG
jgi:cobalt/nickel transport system permease protein